MSEQDNQARCPEFKKRFAAFLQGQTGRKPLMDPKDFKILGATRPSGRIAAG